MEMSLRREHPEVWGVLGGGVFGTRMVLFMNRNDIDRLDLHEGDVVGLVTEMKHVKDDGVERRVDGFIVPVHNIPEGCVGAYYPEANPLIPVRNHAKGSLVPAAKGITVRIVKAPLVVAD